MCGGDEGAETVKRNMGMASIGSDFLPMKGSSTYGSVSMMGERGSKPSIEVEEVSAGNWTARRSSDDGGGKAIRDDVESKEDIARTGASASSGPDDAEALSMSWADKCGVPSIMEGAECSAGDVEESA